MPTRVRDDARFQISFAGRTGRSFTPYLLSAFMVASRFMPGGVAVAQTPGATPEFRANVRDVSQHIQRIVVTLNGSVTIETTTEVTRADVIAQNIADVQILSPKKILIMGRSYGLTNVILQGNDGSQSVFEISVELDLGRLNAAIRNIDPQSDASARSLMGNILLSGLVSSAERAERIESLANLFVPSSDGTHTFVVQNQLDVAGEAQVLLRVVVAEMNRTAARELNINGFLVGDNFKDAFLVNQLGGLNPVNIGGAASSAITGNIPFVTDQNGLLLDDRSTLSIGFPRVQLQAFIRALADNTLLRIMAEPNLVAISGETATFLAGGEFPIPVPQGNQQVTIEFREFGIRLNFTPIVRGHQRIRLRVAPEVSELDFTTSVRIEGFVVPGLTSRASETTVELANGETIAIAGLLSDRTRALGSRVPGIGDVPIIGSLFRSVQYQRNLTELVILVTPEIVSALDAHQRPVLPGENLIDPDDFELYLMGMLEGKGSGGVPAADSENPAVSQLPSDPDHLPVHGPWGHVLTMDVR